jgi:ribosomal protein S10
MFKYEITLKEYRYSLLKKKIKIIKSILNLFQISIVNLPKKMSKITVIAGPFVHKKSRDQFSRTVYGAKL